MSQWIPSGVDLLGYASAVLVLLAFSLRSLIALRSVAIASNVTFIAYATAAHLPPVLVLHAALLPINLWRLRQCLAARARAERFRACLAAFVATRPAGPLESYVRMPQMANRFQDPGGPIAPGDANRPHDLEGKPS